MKIYIPKHLRSIPIIGKFCNIIKAYSEGSQTSVDPFSSYQFSLKNDPVKKFLDLSASQNLVYFSFRGKDYKYNKDTGIIQLKVSEGNFVDVDKGSSDYSILLRLAKTAVSPDINYLSMLFYSVKGTFQVFKYLDQFKIIDATYRYTTRSITIELSDIGNAVEKDRFCQALEDFLSALLYFEELRITIGFSTVVVKSEANTRISVGSRFIKRFNNIINDN